MGFFMLIVHWLVTPFLACYYIKSWFWAITMTFLVKGGYWAAALIAAEIDTPFGSDQNDLPLKQMQIGMNTSLLDLLNPLAQRPPPYDSPGFPELHHKSVMKIRHVSDKTTNVKRRWRGEAKPESKTRLRNEYDEPRGSVSVDGPPQFDPIVANSVQSFEFLGVAVTLCREVAVVDMYRIRRQ